MPVRSLALVAAILLVPVAGADLYIEMKTTRERPAMAGQPASTERGTTRSWFASDRSANQDEAGGRRIIRFDKQEVWDLVPATRTVQVHTFEAIHKAAELRRKEMDSKRRSLESQLRDPRTPDALKERLRAYLQLVKNDYRVTVGNVEEVAGYTCRHYTIHLNGKKTSEIWATEDVGKGVEFNRVQQLSSAGNPELQREMAKIKGVWIKMVQEIKSPVGVHRKVAIATKVVEGEGDYAKEFEIPAGFTRR